MKNLILILLLAFVAPALSAQSITGTWKTIDDETKEAKSQVTIYDKGNGVLEAKIAKLLKSAPDKKCEKCPDARKDQPLVGMIIMENMQLKDGYYQKGRILDPEKGKWYTCSMWLKEGDPNTLVVRGYLGIFYRTQYWYRVN